MPSVLSGVHLRRYRGLKLDLNERSEGAPEWARQWLETVPEDLIWRYTSREPLEAALASRYGLEPNQVLATNGGDEGIMYLFSYLGKSAPVYLPLPTFGMYQEQADIWDMDIREIAPKDDLSLDLDALERAIGRDGGGVAVVVRPNNPTGEMVPYQRMLRLLEVCREQGTMLLVDEAYVEFAEDDLIRALAAFPNLVLLRTFSKAFGLAGVRVGYLMANNTLLHPIRARSLPYNVSSLALKMAERALEEDAMAEMRAYVASVCRERDGLLQRLLRFGVKVSATQGNFLLLHLSPKQARFVSGCMAANGISVRSFTRPELLGCLRITIPSDALHIHEVLAQALDPELICLDIDGCLIDTRPSMDATVIGVVRHFTGQEINVDEIYSLRGRGGFNDDNNVSSELIRQRGKKVPLARVKEVFRNLYMGKGKTAGLYTKETLLVRKELLADLKNRFKLALVTGRNQEELAPARALLGLGSEVPCWTIDDVRKGKPDPEGILSAATSYGVRRVWMVGDNPDDIRAARAAGALPIGVDMGNREALIGIGAPIVLDDINDLGALL